jgi:CheY-like chemotaxis protein
VGAISLRPEGKYMKILIADDSDLEREHLEILLERGNHEVTTAEDGTHAAEAFRRDPTFDLVITDLRMPLMTGLDLISVIKEIRADAKIWLVSGYLRKETETHAYDLGAEKVIWKTNLEHELIRAGLMKDS